MNSAFSFHPFCGLLAFVSTCSEHCCGYNLPFLDYCLLTLLLCTSGLVDLCQLRVMHDGHMQCAVWMELDGPL